MLPHLILTYHAVEPGPTPLCLDPRLFEQHLDCVVASGATSVGVAELAAAIRSGRPRERMVAITFDDGFASVVETAAPLLAERGLTATVFCVACHLGGRNNWPSARGGSFERPLADASALRALTENGHEIGSHGTTHAPLVTVDPDLLHREIVESRTLLEAVLGSPVRSFAYPYGARSSAAARKLVEETYDAACTTRVAPLAADANVYELPRIDAHYVRSPRHLRRALDGSLGPYLLARGLGARARRALRTDYARVA